MDNLDAADFVNRFLEVQPSVYAYIRAAGFDVHDADDLVQETVKHLWAEYAAYDPSRPFVAWAIGFARNLIRKKRRYDKVRAVMTVDTELCERVADLVADTINEQHECFEAEKEYLETCLTKLTERARQLLRLRYFAKQSLAQVAEAAAMTPAAANMMLSRVRSTLMECITKQMAGNDA